MKPGTRHPADPKRPDIRPDDVAVLQYTGGTTGVSKGAVLLHSNIIANALQSEAWNAPAMKTIPAGQQPTRCAPCRCHIFAFTVNMMLGLRMGGKVILIPNPRDLKAVLRELSRHTFHTFRRSTRCSTARFTTPISTPWTGSPEGVAGRRHGRTECRGQALAGKTGCPIVEGYGLSETSPSACCNPVTSHTFSGTIGVPIPGTRLRCLDDDGNDVAPGQPGEIAIKGPQVMAGYWQRPDETAKVATADGYFGPATSA